MIIQGQYKYGRMNKEIYKTKDRHAVYNGLKLFESLCKESRNAVAQKI